MMVAPGKAFSATEKIEQRKDSPISPSLCSSEILIPSLITSILPFPLVCPPIPYLHQHYTHSTSGPITEQIVSVEPFSTCWQPMPQQHTFSSLKDYFFHLYCISLCSSLTASSLQKAIVRLRSRSLNSNIKIY